MIDPARHFGDSDLRADLARDHFHNLASAEASEGEAGMAETEAKLAANPTHLMIQGVKGPARRGSDDQEWANGAEGAVFAHFCGFDGQLCCKPMW